MRRPGSVRVSAGQAYWLAVALLFTAAAAMSYPGLGTVALGFDEQIYLKAGREYVHGDFRGNWQHPPLAKLFFGAGEWVTGSPLGGRYAAATFGLLILGCVVAFTTRAAGRVAGIAAGLAWLAIPRSVRMAGFLVDAGPFERRAMLDVVAAAFATVSLIPGWRWIREGRTRDGVLTGVLAGMAAASKLPAGLYLAATLLVGLVVARERLVRLRQAVVSGLVAVAVFLLAYAPMGRDADDAIDFMFYRQIRHAGRGHTMVYAGEVRDKAPLWGQAWMEADHQRWIGLVVLLAVVAALAGRHRLLAAYVALAAAIPFVFLSLSPVALPFYRYVWQPPLAIITGLGVATLVEAGRQRVVASVTSTAVLVALLVGATVQVSHGAREAPDDYTRLASLLRASGLEHPRVALVGDHTTAMQVYPDDAFLTAGQLARGAPVDAVVLDPVETLRRPVPDVVALLASRCWQRVTIGRLEVHASPAFLGSLSATVLRRPQRPVCSGPPAG